MSCVKAVEFKASRLRRNALSLAYTVSHLPGTSVAQLNTRRILREQKSNGVCPSWEYVHLDSMCLDTETQEGAQLPGFRSCSNHLLVMWPWASYFTFQFYPLYGGCDKHHILLVLHASLLSFSLGPSSLYTWMASSLLSLGALWKFSVRPSWTLLISQFLCLHSTSNHSPSYMSHYPLSCLTSQKWDLSYRRDFV